MLQSKLDSRETAMLFRLAFASVSIAALLVHPLDAASQDMLRYVDLNSPDMSTSEMTRDEVDAALKAQPQGGADQRASDLQGKRLLRLEPSVLDFSARTLLLATRN